MRLLPDSLFEKDNPEFPKWKTLRSIHVWLSNDWNRAIDAYEAIKGKSGWSHKSYSPEQVVKYFTVSYNYYYQEENNESN